MRLASESVDLAVVERERVLSDLPKIAQNLVDMIVESRPNA